jgi:hypothetical protein
VKWFIRGQQAAESSLASGRADIRRSRLIIIITGGPGPTRATCFGQSILTELWRGSGVEGRLNTIRHVTPRGDLFVPDRSVRQRTDQVDLPRRTREAAAPIYALLKGSGSFEPEHVAMLGKVFEDVLETLSLVDREDTPTVMLAKCLVEYAKTGIRDAERLKAPHHSSVHSTRAAGANPAQPALRAGFGTFPYMSFIRRSPVAHSQARYMA